MKMKKAIAQILAAVMLITSMCFGNYAVLAEENVKVTVNGNQLNFDQPPIIKDGRTLVPLRAIFEALGADIVWNEEIQTIWATRGKHQIGIVIGGYNIVKLTNGTDMQTISLDTAPIVVNGRTLVPARAVAESLDCSVNWNDSIKTVEIKTADDGGEQANADDNRIYFDPRIDKLSDVSGVYDGNTLYFNFIGPEIYIYDGSAVKNFNAGDYPQGIIARKGQVYYYGYNNGVVYRLDTATGNRQALFNKDGKVDIDELKLYRDYLLVSGDNKLYVVNVNSGDLIYDSAGIGVTAADGKVFVLTSSYNEPRSIVEVDPTTGSSRTLYEGDEISGLFCAVDGSGIYFCEEGFYFHNISTDERNAISNSEYKNAETAYKQANDSSWHEEWYFRHYDSGVFRETIDTPYYLTMKEKLYSGSGCIYIANNRENVAFRQRKNGHNAVYVMDINGNNRREIINNANNSISTNTETLAPEACAVCGGSGMVTCSYCRGTGKGQTITVLGMPTEQGCTYCGSTGKRLCSGCNGSGQK